MLDDSPWMTLHMSVRGPVFEHSYVMMSWHSDGLTVKGIKVKVEEGLLPVYE